MDTEFSTEAAAMQGKIPNMVNGSLLCKGKFKLCKWFPAMQGKSPNLVNGLLLCKGKFQTW